MRLTLAVDYVFPLVEVKGQYCRCSVRKPPLKSDDTKTPQLDALKHCLRFGVNSMLLPPICSLSVARMMCVIESRSELYDNFVGTLRCSRTALKVLDIMV